MEAADQFLHLTVGSKGESKKPGNPLAGINGSIGQGNGVLSVKLSIVISNLGISSIG